MQKQLNSVREFMEAFGQELPKEPTVPDPSIVSLRWKMSDEENKELDEAIDRVSIFDALLDRLYVSLGDMLAFGESDMEKRAADLLKVEYPTKAIYMSMNLAEYVMQTEKRTALDKTIVVALFRDSNQRLLTMNTAEQLLEIAMEKSILAFSDFPTLGFTREQLILGFDEVHRSNMTKFWTQDEFLTTEQKGPVTGRVTTGGRYIVKDRDGKIVKSPSYSKPNLSPFLGL